MFTPWVKYADSHRFVVVLLIIQIPWAVLQFMLWFSEIVNNFHCFPTNKIQPPLNFMIISSFTWWNHAKLSKLRLMITFSLESITTFSHNYSLHVFPYIWTCPVLFMIMYVYGQPDAGSALVKRYQVLFVR